MSGKVNLAGGMEAPMKLEMQRPGRVRMELTIQGLTMVQAYDGKSGWMIVPFTGKTDAEPMPEDQLRSMKEQSDMDGVLVDYKEKGSQVELVGKEELEGTPVYKLKVTRKEGDVSFLYLDAEGFLELKAVNRRTVNGQEVESEVVMSDYKPEAGVLYPHSMEMKMKGGMAANAPSGMTMTFDKIEINPELPASRFDMPKPAEKAEKKEGAGNPQ
jgi:outer membrane lipoprotein-sorting protein